MGCRVGCRCRGLGEWWWICARRLVPVCWFGGLVEEAGSKGRDFSNLYYRGDCEEHLDELLVAEHGMLDQRIDEAGEAPTPLFDELAVGGNVVPIDCTRRLVSCCRMETSLLTSFLPWASSIKKRATH